MKNILIAMMFIAAANSAQAGSFDLNRTGAKEIKGLETPVPAMGVPGAETKTAPIQNPGWRHQIDLRAEDGTDLKINYHTFVLGNRVIAAPVWVDVSNPVLKGGENVTVTLINYYASTTQIKSSQSIVLKYVGNGRFTAEAGGLEVLRQSHNGIAYYFRQEIAVVVDGKWLVGPVPGGHNFKFNMAMAGARTPAVEKGGGAVPAPDNTAGRYNYNDDYGGISESDCPGGKIVKGSLVCTGVPDAYNLLGVVIDRKYAVESLPAFVENADPVSLGLLPDDCTDTIFYYPYKLVLDGRTVGYAEIIGNANSEAGFRKKTTLKYNAAGKLAVVRIEDFGGTGACSSGSLRP